MNQRQAEGKGAARGVAEPAKMPEDLRFPSLERLFEGESLTALAEMRARLRRTAQALEQVVRHGPAPEAERARLALRAYELSLGLLDELERRRQPAAP